MHPLVYLVVSVIKLINFLIIAWVVLGLLIYFKIVNPYQPLVRNIDMALNRLMEPMLRPIRKYLPVGAGIDISPVILMIILQFVEYTIVYYSI